MESSSGAGASSSRAAAAPAESFASASAWQGATAAAAAHAGSARRAVDSDSGTDTDSDMPGMITGSDSSDDSDGSDEDAQLLARAMAMSLKGGGSGSACLSAAAVGAGVPRAFRGHGIEPEFLQWVLENLPDTCLHKDIPDLVRAYNGDDSSSSSSSSSSSNSSNNSRRRRSSRCGSGSGGGGGGSGSGSGAPLKEGAARPAKRKAGEDEVARRSDGSGVKRHKQIVSLQNQIALLESQRRSTWITDLRTIASLRTDLQEAKAECILAKEQGGFFALQAASQEAIHQAAKEADRAVIGRLRQQLACANEELASLRPKLVDLTAADTDGTPPSPSRPPPLPPPPPSALAQLHVAQQVKLEAVEDMQDEGQYSAQFIDTLQSKIDRLKQVAAEAGADRTVIDAAIA